MSEWLRELVICKSQTSLTLHRSKFPFEYQLTTRIPYSYALAADIQTIPGLPTAPGYLNVDVNVETDEIEGLF